jgi:heterodisulfide reductase subunit A
MVLLFESTRVAESQPYDALILSVGMVPSPGTRQIGEMLQLNFTPEGFVRHYGEVKTSREGVWVCGTACGPKDIETSLEEAYRVSQAIRREKGGRKVEEGTLALRG